jgi:hypothetical protein
VGVVQITRVATSIRVRDDYFLGGEGAAWGSFVAGLLCVALPSGALPSAPGLSGVSSGFFFRY